MKSVWYINVIRPIYQWFISPVVLWPNCAKLTILMM